MSKKIRSADRQPFDFQDGLKVQGVDISTLIDNGGIGGSTYVHPDTHPASVIVQDTTHRFVTDAEKTTWSTGGSVSGDIDVNSLKIQGVDINLIIANTLSAYLSPTFNIAVDKTVANEGDVVTFTTSTTSPVYTQLYYDLLGEPDYSTISTHGGTINGIKAGDPNVTEITIRNDFITDGVKSFWMKVYKDEAKTTLAAESPHVTVNDTSQGAVVPTYTISSSGVTSINEGQALTFNIVTTLVDDNTTLYWKANGTLSVNDVASLTGEVSISGNAGSVTITPYEDSATEGVEYVTLTLYSDSGRTQELTTSSYVNVMDTSQSPPNNTPQFTAALTANVSSASIGDTITYTITPTGGSTGLFDWVVYGLNNSVVTTGSGNMSPLSAKTVQITLPRTETLARFTDTLVFRVYTAGTLTGSVEVGTACTLPVNHVVKYAITPDVWNIPEGASTHIQVVQNYPDSPILHALWWRINAGSANHSDFSNVYGSFQIAYGVTGAFDITATADAVAEGSENFGIELADDSAFATTAGGITLSIESNVT